MSTGVTTIGSEHPIDLESGSASAGGVRSPVATKVVMATAPGYTTALATPTTAAHKIPNRTVAPLASRGKDHRRTWTACAEFMQTSHVSAGALFGARSVIVVAIHVRSQAPTQATTRRHT